MPQSRHGSAEFAGQFLFGAAVGIGLAAGAKLVALTGLASQPDYPWIAVLSGALPYGAAFFGGLWLGRAWTLGYSIALAATLLLLFGPRAPRVDPYADFTWTYLNDAIFWLAGLLPFVALALLGNGLRLVVQAVRSRSHRVQNDEII